MQERHDKQALLQELLGVSKLFLLSPLFMTTLLVTDHLRAGDIKLAVKTTLAGVAIQLLVFVTLAVGYKMIKWALQ